MGLRNALLNFRQIEPAHIMENIIYNELRHRGFGVDVGAVRFAVDQRQEVGQFILTGSAVPQDGITMHTGTGRIARLLMRPMSLYESEESNGMVSLGDLFDGNTDVSGMSSLTIDQIAYLICRGGWPMSIKLNEKASLEVPYTYLDAVVNDDVQRVDAMAKNPDRMRMLLRSLARNITSMATAKTIIDDVNSNEISMTDKTYSSYMNVLKRIFVVEDEAASNLITLKNKVDTSKLGEPSFLMVVTGGEFAYRRKDGVLVVPLGCLKH